MAEGKHCLYILFSVLWYKSTHIRLKMYLICVLLYQKTENKINEHCFLLAIKLIDNIILNIR